MPQVPTSSTKSNIKHELQHSASTGVGKCMAVMCPESEFQHPAQYPTFQHQGGWKSVWYLCAPNQSSNIQHSIQHFSIKGGGKVYGSCVPRIRVPTSSTVSNISASRGVEKCMVVVCPESEFQHLAQNPTFSSSYN